MWLLAINCSLYISSHIVSLHYFNYLNYPVLGKACYCNVSSNWNFSYLDFLQYVGHFNCLAYFVLFLLICAIIIIIIIAVYTSCLCAISAVIIVTPFRSFFYSAWVKNSKFLLVNWYQHSPITDCCTKAWSVITQWNCILPFSSSTARGMDEPGYLIGRFHNWVKLVS